MTERLIVITTDAARAQARYPDATIVEVQSIDEQEDLEAHLSENGIEVTRETL